MTKFTRRVLLSSIAASPLAMPGIVRAQSTSKPVKIGLLSDMGGPYRDVGGPGNRAAVELAVQDFGGSVLDRPIEIVQGDDQNKPDVAASLARQWIDDQGVDVLMDGAASSSGLAIQQIAREKKHIYLITGPASSDFTGKQCSPYGIHFAYDTYALAHGTGRALTKAGGNTWFFITADYAFGYALERDTIAAVQAAGGKVLGNVRAPLATPDFSNYLLQAKASGAKVFGFANAGTDLQNCIKQAAEFGISQSGTRMATLLMAINDVHSLGLQDLPRVGVHGFVLLGHDRPDARVREALGREDGRHGAWPAACGELLRREPLAEVGEGRRHHRRRASGSEDEGDAGQRFLQRQCQDPRGRASDARDVSVAGEDTGGIQIPVRLLQEAGHDFARRSVATAERRRLPVGEGVGSDTRGAGASGGGVGWEDKELPLPQGEGEFPFLPHPSLYQLALLRSFLSAHRPL